MLGGEIWGWWSFQTLKMILKDTQDGAARIDRIMISEEWDTSFNNIKQSTLQRLASDHVPVSLQGGSWIKKKRYFKSENWWLNITGFKDRVQIGGVHSLYLGSQIISLPRVKVYRLNDDGKWDDQGTGHVTVDYLERSEEPGLLVTDEDEHETLLMHRISAEDIYRKQEDTIISWRDPEYSTELALSFQETTDETFHSASSDLRELPPVEPIYASLDIKVLLNSSQIFEKIFGDELILDIVGCLEYTLFA
ncbi:hypothetical protein H5410_004321 [Solanum commersonii]|uniref:PP4R3 EVH1-like domain-containing protein n=1 Tax=Solanum commersonii TaxID=4109 RepID=A0A9J6B7S3_SOLCO|nr:hypothetical protein H5410_004321 [Solanum commersonii]